MKARTFLASFLLLLTFGPASALAEPGDLLRTFVTPLPDQGGGFGGDIAVVGDNVLVADPGANDYAGAAYLFDGTTGELLHTFRSPSTGDTWAFGTRVEAAGDDVLVGATWDYDGGAAYLFDGTTGQFLQEFRNPRPYGPFDGFGAAVTAVGNNVVVGAHREGVNQSGAHWGAAYLFDSTTGGLLHTFEDPRPGVKSLGLSTAALGDYVLLGAPCDQAGDGNVSGVVDLVDGEGHVLRTFRSPTPTPRDSFGYSLDGLGSRVLVGAINDDTAGHNAGAAFLFDVASGELLQSFLDPTPADYGRFGWSVAAVGDNLLIGAPHSHGLAEGPGVAHLFDATTGALLHTFLDPAPHSRNFFGQSVAALGNNILVAASGDGNRDGYAGAVYLFEGPVVPEPSTLLLLATAGVTVLVLGGRRRKTPNAGP